jgi:hypothetical protein
MVGVSCFGFWILDVVFCDWRIAIGGVGSLEFGVGSLLGDGEGVRVACMTQRAGTYYLTYGYTSQELLSVLIR